MTITKSQQFIVFNCGNPDLLIDSLPAEISNKIDRVQKVNSPVGASMLSYTNGSDQFEKLEQDNIYLVYSKPGQLNYEIPGSVSISDYCSLPKPIENLKVHIVRTTENPTFLEYSLSWNPPKGRTLPDVFGYKVEFRISNTNLSPNEINESSGGGIGDGTDWQEHGGYLNYTPDRDMFNTICPVPKTLSGNETHEFRVSPILEDGSVSGNLSNKSLAPKENDNCGYADGSPCPEPGASSACCGEWKKDDNGNFFCKYAEFQEIGWPGQSYDWFASNCCPNGCESGPSSGWPGMVNRPCGVNGEWKLDEQGNLFCKEPISA